MKKENKSYSLLMSALIITGCLVAYVHQMSPSPILLSIGETYGVLNSDTLLNMSISIMFLPLVVFSIYGGTLEKRIGTSNLYILSLAFVATGLLMNFVATNYTIFLIGRVVYGIGFGMSIPFIGSAIMRWYAPENRDIMTTINSFFPFAGTVLAFFIIAPEYKLFHENIKLTFGVWGILIAILAVMWIVMIGNPDRKFIYTDEAEEDEGGEASGNLYIELLKKREIRLLSVCFLCDFTVYSYVATILPTLLFEISDMDEITANIWAAVAFPVAGVAGCVAGSAINKVLGLRRPTIIAGQLLKAIGTTVAVLGSDNIVILIAGIGIFGIASGLWLPSFFGVPTEMPGMSSTMVAGAFAMMSSCGFVMGFIAPALGGTLTTMLMGMAPAAVSAHVFGLKWSLLILGIINMVAFAAALFIPETGKKRKVH